MLTIANKGTYLVKNCQKHANVIYERPLMESYQQVSKWLKVHIRTVRENVNISN